MTRILVLQHSDVGGPGRIGATLRDHGFKLDIRRPDLSTDKGGTPCPESIEGIGGLVVLGGPQNVDQPHPWLKTEQSLIRQAHEAELPVLGVCLGAQLVAQALGGTVSKMPKPEVGFTQVDLTVAAQVHTLLAGVPWSGMWYQAHGHEVSEMPPGAMLLASSELCKVQMFTVGLRTYGVQFHLEADQPMVTAIAKADHDQLSAAGLTVDALSEQAKQHYDRFAIMADRICLNLISNAFMPTRARLV